MRSGRIVRDIVIGRQRPRIYRQWRKHRAVEGINRCPRNHTLHGVGAGKRNRYDRRAPIGMTVILLVFDGDERLECVGHAIIELRGEARDVAKIAVDKAVELRSTNVEAIIEPSPRRTAARAKMGTEGAK